jgi:hypothetical protein
MSRSLSTTLAHPTMRVLLDRSSMELSGYREALAELVTKAYGNRQCLGSVTERRDRLALYKLSNLIGKLDLMADAPVFDIGYRCPEQIRSYHGCLTRSLPRAFQAGLTTVHLAALDDLHERVWQILNEVTAFYDGLS